MAQKPHFISKIFSFTWIALLTISSFFSVGASQDIGELAIENSDIAVIPSQVNKTEKLIRMRKNLPDITRIQSIQYDQQVMDEALDRPRIKGCYIGMKKGSIEITFGFETVRKQVFIRSWDVKKRCNKSKEIAMKESICALQFCSDQTLICHPYLAFIPVWKNTQNQVIRSLDEYLSTDRFEPCHRGHRLAVLHGEGGDLDTIDILDTHTKNLVLSYKMDRRAKPFKVYWSLEGDYMVVHDRQSVLHLLYFLKKDHYFIQEYVKTFFSAPPLKEMLALIHLFLGGMVEIDTIKKVKNIYDLSFNVGATKFAWIDGTAIINVYDRRTGFRSQDVHPTTFLNFHRICFSSDMQVSVVCIDSDPFPQCIKKDHQIDEDGNLRCEDYCSCIMPKYSIYQYHLGKPAEPDLFFEVEGEVVALTSASGGHVVAASFVPNEKQVYVYDTEGGKRYEVGTQNIVAIDVLK